MKGKEGTSEVNIELFFRQEERFLIAKLRLIPVDLYFEGFYYI